MRPDRPAARRRTRAVGLALSLTLTLALTLTCGLMLGCSSEPGVDGLQCPNDLPASCPAAMPSYQNDVMQIVQRGCVGCHSATGVEYNRPLDTYSALYAQRQGVLTQIYGCRMPPAGAPPLTSAERQQILTWLVCKSPNN